MEVHFHWLLNGITLWKDRQKLRARGWGGRNQAVEGREQAEPLFVAPASLLGSGFVSFRSL